MHRKKKKLSKLIEKSKRTKKTLFFAHFWQQNHRKFSKTTQKCSTIYDRSPVQLDQYLKYVEIKINFENLC